MISHESHPIKRINGLQLYLLTKEEAQKNVSELIRLTEVAWTDIGEPAWTEENVMRDLPGKWELSHYATIDGKMAGFSIGTIRNDIEPLRQDGRPYSFWDVMLVLPEYRSRRPELGGKKVSYIFAQAFIDASRTYGVPEARLTCRMDNIPINLLHGKFGYNIIGVRTGTDGVQRWVKSLPFPENQ